MPNSENKRDVKKIVFFTLFLLLISLICYDVFSNYQALTDQPLLASGSNPLILEIKPETSARTFVNRLYSQKLVRSKHILLALIRARGLSNHLQAGIYQVNPGESVVDLLARVVKGDVLVESFRILDGSTLVDLKQNLAQSPYLNSHNVDFSTIAGQHLSAEGLLMADTYYYRAGSDASSLLKQANQNLLTYLDMAWQNRDPTLPYKNSYELLIAASIIEKEASLPLERKIIAGIIVKRLKINMPLQMDPTVLYALANRASSTATQGATKRIILPLHHQDLKINSPYNTYLHRGLPPTPIAMVGKQSLDAAAHPDETNYLYFFAKGDGSHQFSTNYQEQQQAIQQFKLRATTP
ncbi:MAG: ABC transporter substrate-binding protein [Legionellales bacterium RIFCSPHIGHO2_12_FULL_42_9]|nr:MAG: ABC transporter substrate-binding protein [Legionellales bacterium RIFCSPHIGHO2_12_FULL_42_9]